MFYYQRYVSVGELKEEAEKEIAKLVKKGANPHPIAPFQGRIAKSFLGQSWCDSLDNFDVDESRLSRGKRYLRAGSVCDLAINQGKVSALVRGSRLYRVKIGISPLPKDKWKHICAGLSQNPEAMIAILRGELSKELLNLVCAQAPDLIPDPDNMDFQCGCPDYAHVCKHVAAVYYGIGHLLDLRPELLFTLRQVDPWELIRGNAIPPPPRPTRALANVNLGEIFGIDLELPPAVPLPPEPPAAAEPEAVLAEAAPVVDAPVVELIPAESHPDPAGNALDTEPEELIPVQAAVPNEPARRLRSQKSVAMPVIAQTFHPSAVRLFDAKHPSPAGIRQLRVLAGLTTHDMARALGVTLDTLTRWESAQALRLRPESLKKLADFQKKLLRRVKRR